ncbi:CYTIP protein, partial [Atractosteus spatula]|nr:CYTIP protein [Atractosteus spatula]
WCDEIHIAIFTMNFRRLIRQNSNDNYILENSLRRKTGPCFNNTVDSETDNKHLQKVVATLGTLPRGRKQVARSNSLVDYTDSQRTVILLEKQDNETYGFEIQTYGLQHQNTNTLEMCTFVCKVQEDSPAENAGLTPGDVIVAVNGISTEGFSHQHIVDLIKSSANCLRLETINGTAVKRIELETKLKFLKKTLREKWVEFQSLLLQEQRLARGNLNECSPHSSLDSPMSPMSPGADSLAFSPMLRCKYRFSSGSSCKSQLSITTEDSEDTFYQASVFEDSNPMSPCRRVSMDDECFFSRDCSTVGVKASVNRTRSISLASSGSISPSWDVTGSSSLFGTLPRKKRGSVRKRFMKFIPGLNRPVVEEEIHQST